MSTNKIRIKMGSIEFEAEGDSELIERERAQFFSLLPQAIIAVSPVVPQPIQVIGAKEAVYEESENNPPINNLLAAAPQVNYQSIASFLNDKKFSNDVDLVMGIGYFIECVEKAGIFTSRDIENKLTVARKGKPSNISHAINQNIKKGYIRECSDKKDNLKAFSILDDGIKWCESYKTAEPDAKKKPTRSKHSKANLESPLLSISLDELNLENYCDVSKLSKFNEQMLFVMLIYTKERQVEYFSFNDIVAVFKTNFKLPATDRKVRYAFDNGGTMFDKKVEKKVAYHKLMSSGIKEAERIVSQEREIPVTADK